MSINYEMDYFNCNSSYGVMARKVASSIEILGLAPCFVY